VTRPRSNIAVAVLVSLALLTSSCGYLLHPARRDGRAGRVLDPLTVLFDCLWLIPGIIPGVVALVIDGTQNTWSFGPGEIRRVDLPPGPGGDYAVAAGSRLKIQVRELPADVAVGAVLMNASGRRLAEALVTRRAAGPGVLEVAVPAEAAGSALDLVLEVKGRTAAKWRLRVRAAA
jgi:hypothetical protein